MPTTYDKLTGMPTYEVPLEEGETPTIVPDVNAPMTRSTEPYADLYLAEKHQPDPLIAALGLTESEVKVAAEKPGSVGPAVELLRVSLEDTKAKIDLLLTLCERIEARLKGDRPNLSSSDSEVG